MPRLSLFAVLACAGTVVLPLVGSPPAAGQTAPNRRENTSRTVLQPVRLLGLAFSPALAEAGILVCHNNLPRRES